MPDNVSVKRRLSNVADTPSDWHNSALWFVLLGSGVGLLASFVLSFESISLARNPQVALNCDINSVLSCTTVASHWSADILGFSNSFIGMMTLPVMITIAVALLAGARLPRWFMRAAWVGALAGVGFAAWMFYMSFVVIGVLCPWCLTLDIGMLLLFYGLSRYNISTGLMGGDRARLFLKQGYDTLLAAVAFVIVLGLIISKFGTELF